MSKQNRKILIPVRRDKRSFTSRSHHSNHATTQAVKRSLEHDCINQFPNKKSNLNAQPENIAAGQSTNIKPNSNFSYNSPAKKSSYAGPPKNIAARRMENLRKSLEIHRKSLNNSVNKITSEPSKSENISQNDESMEWDEVDEKKIINNINELRKEIKYELLPTVENLNDTFSNKLLPTVENLNDTFSNKLLPTVENSNDIFSNKLLPTVEKLNDASSNKLTKNGVFIVVDTNIFLSQLQFVSQLRANISPGLGPVTIIVPWIVIQELDYMKESNCSKSLSKAARIAVQYIHTQLSNKNPYFAGQSVLEASKYDLSSKNPDDGILFCCLQLVESQKSVVLLSNDINLRNKSLISNIPAYSSTDIVFKLTSNNFQNETIHCQCVEKIKILLSNLLTHIITNELKLAYGDIWHRMVPTQPPFTVEEALNYLLKYWIAVFSFSLQKQCKFKVQEFSQFLKNRMNDHYYQPQDQKTFIEYSLTLCIYLKNGLTNYKELIVDCIKNIQKNAE